MCLLFENRFYALLWKSVKGYFSAVVHIHGLQIDYYEKQWMSASPVFVQVSMPH